MCTMAAFGADRRPRRRELREGKARDFGRARVAAMEACASSHHWARQIGALGPDVRSIAPTYVKPIVKRNKNDTADAEEIGEAASRPTMRFVAARSTEKQASGMTFKTRDLLVRQRTQIINALRGHIAEYGVVAPQRTRPYRTSRRVSARFARWSAGSCDFAISVAACEHRRARRTNQSGFVVPVCHQWTPSANDVEIPTATP